VWPLVGITSMDGNRTELESSMFKEPNRIGTQMKENEKNRTSV